MKKKNEMISEETKAMLIGQIAEDSLLLNLEEKAMVLAYIRGLRLADQRDDRARA